MADTTPAQAGQDAANRTPEEQQKILEDAKAPTEKQTEAVVAAAGNTPPAPDHTAGTDADTDDEARAIQAEPVDTAAEAVQATMDGNIIRHADQRLGVVSASAYNAHVALKLSPKTEWSEALVKAIKAYQEELGQKATGYLTRDQCRRLGLSYLD